MLSTFTLLWTNHQDPFHLRLSCFPTYHWWYMTTPNQSTFLASLAARSGQWDVRRCGLCSLKVAVLRGKNVSCFSPSFPLEINVDHKPFSWSQYLGMKVEQTWRTPWTTSWSRAATRAPTIIHKKKFQEYLSYIFLGGGVSLREAEPIVLYTATDLYLPSSSQTRHEKIQAICLLSYWNVE